MTLDQIDEYLSFWVLPSGQIIETAAHRTGDWRPGIVTSLNPPTAEILGEPEQRIKFRNAALTAVSVGDPVMFQRVGPVWVAVYLIEVL